MEASAITVAVASCGRPQALGDCLAGLAAQTHSPAEVLVVDQAPSEAARAIVEESGLAPTRYVEQERLGLSASRNLALRLARSPMLAVTDDDCVPDPDWLAVIAAALTRAPAPGAVTGRVLPPTSDQPPGSFAISGRLLEVPLDQADRPHPWRVGSGGNFAAPVALLREVGGWDERLGAGSGGRAAEDIELIDRLLVAGAIVRYEPASIVRHAWQTRARRIETRWSYGFGIGAVSGLRLRRRDLFALRLLADYARLHVRPLLVAVIRRRWDVVSQRVRALASLGPGLVYGFRAATRRPASSSGGER